MNKIINSKFRAFTLVEMIIVVSILSILSLVVSKFIVQGFSSYKNGKQNIDMAQDSARVMRDFEYATRAATVVKTAGVSELSFYRYYDLTSTSPKQVRYFLENNVFKAGITEPVGTTPNITYPSNQEQIHYLIENVDSLKLQYFDDNNLEVAQPASLASVRMVQLTISLKTRSGNRFNTTTQTTKVNLRNLKRNL